MRLITELFIHCSASPNGAPKSLKEIRDIHVRVNGWSDVGYHYLIDVGGERYVGRKESVAGAGVQGRNRNSLHICMIGYDKFDQKQWDSLKLLVEDVKKRYAGIKILGHRDASPDLNGDGKISKSEWIKLCPSFDVSAWILGGMKAPNENLR